MPKTKIVFHLVIFRWCCWHGEIFRWGWFSLKGVQSRRSQGQVNMWVDNHQATVKSLQFVTVFLCCETETVFALIFFFPRSSWRTWCIAYQLKWLSFSILFYFFFF